MAGTSPIVTRGYGATFGSIGLVVTAGYLSGSAPPPSTTTFVVDVYRGRRRHHHHKMQVRIITSLFLICVALGHARLTL